MKKNVVGGLFALLLMVGCSGNKSQETSTDVVEVSDSASMADFAKEHNARLSLDYEGSYTGVLPTASGSGMEVVIDLADSTYTKKVKYVGKSNAAIESKGKYSWDDAGLVVTLESEDKPNQYFVSEGVLYQLDVDGKRIEGEMAEEYALTK